MTKTFGLRNFGNLDPTDPYEKKEFPNWHVTLIKEQNHYFTIDSNDNANRPAPMEECTPQEALEMIEETGNQSILELPEFKELKELQKHEVHK